ncbi:hypothetical protein BGZ72_009030 [Mortierella alpina]|nr:hypothetical protein BGZ72_009030 [Mortierella alpina]
MDHKDLPDIEGSFVVVPNDSPSSPPSSDSGLSHIALSQHSDADSCTLNGSTVEVSARKGSVSPVEQASLLQQELQSVLTPGKTFENWARTFRCVPEQYYTPSTEEEVIKIIHLARLSGKRVKAIGTGHSPSDLACTDGIMINTDKLDELLHVDKEKRTVTVAAGMKLEKLHKLLELRDLAISNLGSISEQSVAGAMSTATHGTGAEYASLCASVLDLTFITATGAMIYCSKSEKPDIFNAAVCSLGALGIITRMTLQCEPAFRLENKQEPAKLDEVLNNLDSIIHSAEHVRLWWYPHTDNVVVWRANRTTKSRPIERVDDSVKVFNFDCLFPQYVNEWSIPWSRTAEAVRALDQFIENGSVKVESGVGVDESIDEKNEHALKVVKKEAGLKVHFPIEIRFVKKDDVWLSPAYGVDSCYIGIIMYRPYGKPVPYKRFWAGFEQIMASFEGRPHWAKAHSVSFEGLKQSYPKLAAFSEIRQQLDPEGMFLNDYLCRHLVPASTS